MNPSPTRLPWKSVIATPPNGSVVRITSVRKNEIVFDRLRPTSPSGDPAETIYETVSSAHGVGFPGYDPEVDELPAITEIIAAIANPPAVVAAVPASVSRRQLLRALFLATGVKDTDILASLTAIPDPAARYLAGVDFTEALDFERAHPLVAQLAQTLGLSTAQVDDIFRAAALT